MLLFVSCQTEPEQPNIVFIMSDDHAYQAISAYGSVLNETPNIDRLAEEGMLFNSAFVTNSICAPSRAVILTGKYSHLNGVLDNRLPFDTSQVTYPRILQKHGYQTAMIGKWHLKTEPKGFDFWKVLPGQGNYYNPDFRTPDGDERIEGYVTDIITDVALDWLKSKRKQDKPFLLVYQHKAPHGSWWPGPDHLTTYENTVFPEPSSLFDDYETRGSAAHEQEMTILHHMNLYGDLKIKPEDPLNVDADSPRETRAYKRNYKRLTDEQRAQWDEVYDKKMEEFLAMNPSGDDLLRWKYQRYMQDYLGCVASVDDNLGRILDYLDETGLAENTIVFYTSDQGFYLGEHGWFDKRWMYEESLKTPLIIRWPGEIQPGSVSDEMVSALTSIN
jgi:arylsulfatase A-like enzyme